MKMSSKKEDMMNDSESEDEDYVPPEADEDEPSSETLATDLCAASVPILSSIKQKSVDDAFQDLFGKPYVAKTNTQKKKPKSKKALKKKKILSDIFGGASVASKLIASSGDFVKSDSEFRKRKGALKQLATELKKEQVKFAGQMIEVERTVVGGEKEQHMPRSESAGSAAKPMGIDSVLSQIKGPQKVTTIDKTNIDWETFKDKTGLEEELKKKAEGKDAYLVKKDFLNRVDARRFEQEKDERNRKRAATAFNAK